MKYLLILLLCSCASRPPIRGSERYPDVAEAIDKFEKLFKLKVDIDVKVTEKLLGQTKKEVVGVCYYFPKHIELLERHIKLFPEYTEELVFHELGHCIMKLEHDNSRLNIMTSYLLPADFYYKNRKKLLQDLYYRCKYISGVCK